MANTDLTFIPTIWTVAPALVSGATLLDEYKAELAQLSTVPSIYTPTGNSIQNRDKGRLDVEILETYRREVCSCSDCQPDQASDEPRIAASVWGIDIDLNLAQQAADFYLLYDLNLDGLDQGLFDDKVAFLSHQFELYTDMAIGGELRHLSGRASDGAHIPPRIKTALAGEFRWNRGAAWRGWHELREEFGIDMLNDAVEGFNAFYQCGYGGTAWANIADTLLRREKNEISPLMFIDMCWGMEHNSGSYFSKIWASPALVLVLNANLYWNVDTLYKFSSLTISKLHKEAQCTKDVS